MTAAHYTITGLLLGLYTSIKTSWGEFWSLGEFSHKRCLDKTLLRASDPIVDLHQLDSHRSNP